MRTLPNLDLQAFFTLGEDGWNDEFDLNTLKVSVLTQGGFIDKVAATPGAPVEGDVYIFSEVHPTQHNKVAVYDAAVWKYFTPREGWLLYNRTANYYEKFDGVAWAELVMGGGAGGGGSASGAVFPVTPAANDQFYRTDRKIEYVWDGVRWLSTQVFVEHIGVGDALGAYGVSVGGAHRGGNPWAGKYDIFIEDYFATVYHTGASNWTISLVTLLGAPIAAVNSVTGAASDIATTQAVNAVLLSTAYSLQVNFTKNSGAGAIYPHSAFRYRLIG